MHNAQCIIKIKKNMLKHSKIWLLIGLMGLTGCSSEDDFEGPVTEQGVPVTLTSYVTSYTTYQEDDNQENNKSRMTRNTWAPEGYVENVASDAKPAIGAFFTRDANGEANVSAACEQRRFWYSSEKWHIDDNVDASPVVSEATYPYQIYGYLPYNAATASIAPNSSYANGAVLTLTGLSGIMTKDVCVMVGAKEGTSSTVTGLNTGKFDCVMKAGGVGYENYLFLLFDHIYAKLLFKFTINANYAALRTIKIKRLELMAYTDYTYSSNKKMKKKQSTTITLQANNTGASPIVSISDLTADASSGDMDPVLLFYDENNPLVLDPSSWEEYATYVPEVPSFFMLKTTYDVYDKQNNLIRKTCVAENKINPRALFSKEKLDRGKEYILNLTVNPTYLYVLSEPDLDNPTIVVN